MRRILKILTSRLLIVAPLVVLQLIFFVLLFYRVALSTRILPAMSLIAFMATIYIINRDEDPAYKIAWIIVILGMPIIGVPLYLLAGNRHVPDKLRNGTIQANESMEGLLKVDPELVAESRTMDPDIRNMLNYGVRNGFPVYQNTESRYFSSGEEWFPVYLEELKKAKHFIFIEFFIIERGSMWNEVLDILKQKVQEGVEVKIIYDDFGSITLPWKYDKKLKEEGIEAYRFNHVRPAFIIQMNNRDHRKITVIDNNVAFTGGVNLSDEYANRIKRFGYWKDSAVMLHGEAVWSMTVMFLGMLTFCRGKKSDPVDYKKYRVLCDRVNDGGLYLPYSDTPTDKECIALNMHLNMVTHAKSYIYIDTPYLILTETMKQALMRAAGSGVDVRILTPHIPDKRLVFEITRGYYRQLIEAGVRIYEYTPGFNHCKNFVSDDRIAIVGSTNTDYRTYFLHFENAVMMYNTTEIGKIRDNFLDALKQSREITEEDVNHTFLIVRLMRSVLNIFIPLL